MMKSMNKSAWLYYNANFCVLRVAVNNAAMQDLR